MPAIATNFHVSWLRKAFEASALIPKLQGWTYRLSTLTVIIQLELNDDTLVEAESATLNNRCSVAKVNAAIRLEKLANLIWTNSWTKFALNKEET